MRGTGAAVRVVRHAMSKNGAMTRPIAKPFSSSAGSSCQVVAPWPAGHTTGPGVRTRR